MTPEDKKELLRKFKEEFFCKGGPLQKTIVQAVLTWLIRNI